MENASKALIIAGAILLSIVLITLGVVIIGRGQEAVDKANIDDQVVSTWNQKFVQYAGDSVSGTNVNVLINSVLSANATSNTNGDTDKYILISDSAVAANKSGITVTNDSASSPKYTKNCTKVAANSKYKVSVEYGSKGYISKIIIEK
jgi:hypothetical protein